MDVYIDSIVAIWKKINETQGKLWNGLFGRFYCFTLPIITYKHKATDESLVGFEKKVRFFLKKWNKTFEGMKKPTTA